MAVKIRLRRMGAKKVLFTALWSRIPVIRAMAVSSRKSAITTRFRIRPW